jgi:hypothetical protein
VHRWLDTRNTQFRLQSKQSASWSINYMSFWNSEVFLIRRLLVTLRWSSKGILSERFYIIHSSLICDRFLKKLLPAAWNEIQEESNKRNPKKKVNMWSEFICFTYSDTSIALFHLKSFDKVSSTNYHLPCKWEVSNVCNVSLASYLWNYLEKNTNCRNLCVLSPVLVPTSFADLNIALLTLFSGILKALWVYVVLYVTMSGLWPLKTKLKS